jgi:hypothetical protein
MAIHENLTRIPKPRLREVGVSKAVEMAKVARRDGKTFDCVGIPGDGDRQFRAIVIAIPG